MTGRHHALFTFVTLALLFCGAGCSPEPARVEIVPSKIILEGAGSTKQLEAKVYDKEGNEIKEGVDPVWFTEDLKLIKLSATGEVTGIASGEAEVDVEIVGTELKATADIRIKIASSIKVSHPKLRLWNGQVKENVWAEVHSEKDAFIEGYLPEWSSEDPTIVKVEPIVDPNRRQSWVKMTGMKSGNTNIIASFRGISESIPVGVFDEDEQVALDGTRIPRDTDDGKDKEDKKKKK